jgi:hypothetical protein
MKYGGGVGKMKQKLRVVLIVIIVSTILFACDNDTAAISTDSSVSNSTEQPSEVSNTEDTTKLSDEVPESTVSETTSTNEQADINGGEGREGEEGDGELDEPSETILLPEPPFAYYLSEKVNVTENQSIKLSLKSSSLNNITDEETWFSNNNLSLNTFQIPNSYRNMGGNLPSEIADTWNELIITSAFYDDFYIYCTYGGDYAQGFILNIYDLITYDMVYSIDFSNYRFTLDLIEPENDSMQQKIYWAEIKDNILYISHSHNTYAESTGNRNAYITAIDLTDMSILWRTDALVSNSYNFIIVDQVIICGYGFTSEPDYLYQVDRYTGKVMDKILLKTAPTYIIKKDNILFVRTYNTDYEFDIVP